MLIQSVPRFSGVYALHKMVDRKSHTPLEEQDRFYESEKYQDLLKNAFAALQKQGHIYPAQGMIESDSKLNLFFVTNDVHGDDFTAYNDQEAANEQFARQKGLKGEQKLYERARLHGNYLDDFEPQGTLIFHSPEVMMFKPRLDQ